jgi:CRISPR/Cas system CMR-associated protein Cmr1 (group 7 of RAMP superfamily)
MNRMKKIVDSLNEHVKHLKKSGYKYEGVSTPPLFVELYFEAISLKLDPKRNPSRALYLIDEMDKLVKNIFGDTDRESSIPPIVTSEQQQGLHELLKKAREDTLSGQNEFYKSILLALVQCKHHL